MKSITTRMMSFLVAIMLVFGAVGQSMTVAYASSSIFDLVTEDGSINEGSEVATSNPDGGFGIVINKYKSIAVALLGILTITMLIFMLIQFTKLGAAGDNEMARKKAIMGILTTGIATALLGGATIVVGFFWGALSGDSGSSGGGSGGGMPGSGT